ncbi:unnamed protein product [Effrenium voratum]|nr:unnamed protein product [Effrenium voratum]
MMPSGDDSFDKTTSSSHDQISAPHASGHPELLAKSCDQDMAHFPVDIDHHTRRAGTLATHSSEISRQIEEAMGHIDAKLETLLYREEERHTQTSKRLARGRSTNAFRVMYMEEPLHVNGGHGKPRSKELDRVRADI